MDLIGMYINRGRFGEFVTSVIESEYERRKTEAEKDNEWKLWTMYIHSMAEESFNDWKERILKSVGNTGGRNSDDDLTEEGIQAILDKLFPTPTP